MKRTLAVATLLGLAPLASAQVTDVIAPDGSYTFLKDSQGRIIFGVGIRPTPNQNLGIPTGIPFYDAAARMPYVYAGTSWTSLNTSPTFTTPTLTSPTITGAATFSTSIQAQEYTVSMIADHVVQPGMVVMPDAATALGFDAATGGGTLAVGIFSYSSGVRSVAATAYPITIGGITRVAISEDSDVALAEYLTMSAVAGYADSAGISTIGKNIGRVLETAPVTNVIVFNGCTGGSGCINTLLNTPNAGPAGQITLSADVAAQGWAVGDPVIYWDSGGAAPTGMATGFVYWLTSVATTNVTISATRGGAVLVPTSQGTDATQYLQKLPLAIISIQ